MKKIIILFCFLIRIQSAFSQNAGIDGMFQKIAAEKDDNIRVDLLLEFFRTTQDSDPVLDMQYAQKLLLQSQKNNDKISSLSQIRKYFMNLVTSTVSVWHGIIWVSKTMFFHHVI